MGKFIKGDVVVAPFPYPSMRPLTQFAAD